MRHNNRMGNGKCCYFMMVERKCTVVLRGVARRGARERRCFGGKFTTDPSVTGRPVFPACLRPPGPGSECRTPPADLLSDSVPSGMEDLDSAAA